MYVCTAEHIAALRLQHEELRSSNVRMREGAAVALAAVDKLTAKVDKARRFKRVIEAERLETELAEARAKLARISSQAASLRRSTEVREVTRLRDAVLVRTTEAAELQVRMRHHEEHLEWHVEAAQTEVERRQEA